MTTTPSPSSPRLQWTYSFPEDGAERRYLLSEVHKHDTDTDIYWLPAYIKNLNGRRQSGDIQHTRWIMADIDPPKDVWRDGREVGPGALDAWRAATLAKLEAMEPRLTLIVDSGRGYQYGYELKASTSPETAEACAYALAGEDGDKCWYRNAVFRLWGFKNSKTGRTASIVRYEPETQYFDTELPQQTPPARGGSADPVTSAVEHTLELDALGEKSPRVAYVIKYGEKPAFVDEPQFESRNEAVYYVVNELLRLGVPDGQILGVLLNKNYQISDRTYREHKKGQYVERRNPEAHARKELATIKSKAEAATAKDEQPEDTRTIISPARPMTVARQFRDALHADLIFFREEFFTYSYGRYYVVGEAELKSELAHWLETCWIVKKVGEELKKLRFHPDNKTVNAVFSMLKNIVFLAAPNDPDNTKLMPFWKTGTDDDNFPPEHCLVCGQEIVNLVSGRSRDVTPDFVTVNAIDVSYDPSAICPTWLRCLGQWFDDRADDCDTLQEFLGLTLINEMRFQKGLVVWGAKRSGKGTIIRTHKSLLGMQNMTFPKMKSLDETFGLQPLVHAKLAVFADARTEDRGSLMVTETLLGLIGCDPANVNRKGIEELTGVQLNARVLINGNSPPNFRDDTGTIASRFIVIEMPTSFYGKEDVFLDDKLQRELPGYLNWCMAGLARLLRNGRFTESEAAVAAREEMEIRSSPIKSWFAENCTITADAWTATADLYDNYRLWCEGTGNQPLAKNVFATKLRPINPKMIRAGKPCPKEGDTLPGRVPGYYGIALAKDPEWEEWERQQRGQG